MTGADIRRLDQEALAHIASMYYRVREETGDDREAFVSTCREAILAGYTPAACWVSAKMLAAGRPTHVLAFQSKGSQSYIMVIVGGVSISSELDVMYNPEDGKPGWRLIEGEALEVYQKWAREHSSSAQQAASGAS